MICIQLLVCTAVVGLWSYLLTVQRYVGQPIRVRHCDQFDVARSRGTFRAYRDQPFFFLVDRLPRTGFRLDHRLKPGLLQE